MNRQALANAIAAMRPEWKIGEASELAWKEFVREFQNGNLLLFPELAEVNIQRAQRWHGGGIEEWVISEWTNAMAGEAGEACNAAKKMRRIECAMQQADGDTPAPKSLEEAKLKIMKEIGDTVIYADLVCQRIGVRMEDAVRMAFNQVSEREGFPERL